MTVLTTELVSSLVSEVLGGMAVAETTPLLDAPGFTSLAIVDLVERLETRLGTEIPPQLIVPETFETPTAIAAALAGLVPPEPATGPRSDPAPAGRTEVREPARFLHDLVDAAAATGPDRVAVAHEGRTTTYGGLKAASEAAARWLAARGVRRGDRVVVGLGNVPEQLVALHALSRLGATCVPVDPTTPAWSLAALVADVEPTLVVGRLGEAANGLPAVAEWAVSDPGGALPLATGISSDPAAIIYTSGSTGRPKGVVSPHRTMLFAIDAIGARIRVRPDDVIGCVLPLTFDYGLYQSFLAARRGAALVLGGPADAGVGLLRFLVRHGITGLPVVPSLAASLVRLEERQPPEERARLRWISNTGAALMPSLSRRLRELHPGAELYLMFGLTECKRTTILLPEEYDERPTSVGRPLDDTEVVVVDPATGQPLPPGRTGEIVVRGPHVMAGYWRVPAEQDRRFRVWGGTRELALFTGDMGHVDEAGYLYFDGRTDDLYKSRGFRVSAIEVELAASDVPGVRECAVVKPEGDRPATLVATGDTTPAALRAGLLERLDEFKVPERIEVVAELPHSANGKVDRAAVAAMVGGGS